MTLRAVLHPADPGAARRRARRHAGAQPSCRASTIRCSRTTASPLVSRDKFFLVIETSDPKFSETETRKLLESIGGTHIELVED